MVCSCGRKRYSLSCPLHCPSIDAPSALQFFEVHIGADEIHSEVGAGMVRRHTRTEGEREAGLGTARECAEALWSFLDGCEREFVPTTQNREPGT